MNICRLKKKSYTQKTPLKTEIRELFLLETCKHPEPICKRTICTVSALGLKKVGASVEVRLVRREDDHVLCFNQCCQT